jgi:hypothetical protein
VKSTSKLELKMGNCSNLTIVAHAHNFEEENPFALRHGSGVCINTRHAYNYVLGHNKHQKQHTPVPTKSRLKNGNDIMMTKGERIAPPTNRQIHRPSPLDINGEEGTASLHNGPQTSIS